MPDLTIPGPDGDLPAYVAEPHRTGPWPGVVVVQDAFGLSDDIRDQADRLAAYGYLAAAPDLYAGGGLRCVVASLRAARTGQGHGYAEIEATRRWLADRDDCTGRIGVIGFCMGGGFALLSAPRYEFAAAAVNYGDVPRDAQRRLVGCCPVVASYGGRDRRLADAPDRLAAALTALGVEHDVKTYPQARHGFLNRVNAGPALTPLLRVMDVGHHHPSAEDAWRRIDAFFREHLAGPAGVVS